MNQRIRAILSLLLVVFSVNHLQAQKTFVHPGILHNQASLDRIYAIAQNKTMPEYALTSY